MRGRVSQMLLDLAGKVNGCGIRAREQVAQTSALEVRGSYVASSWREKRGHPNAHASEPRTSKAEVLATRYCNVTSTWITPVPWSSGWSALPTTAPSIWLRSVPFMA